MELYSMTELERGSGMSGVDMRHLVLIAPDADVIEFSVPLPPPALRSNSRAHWRTKMGAKQAYSRTVYWEARAKLDGRYDRWSLGLPTKRAHVTYTWKHAGVAPDIGNLGANLKALQDILCMAPNTGRLTANNTTYLGLVEDDKGIHPEYRLEKVARRAAEGVFMEIRRLSEER